MSHSPNWICRVLVSHEYRLPAPSLTPYPTELPLRYGGGVPFKEQSLLIVASYFSLDLTTCVRFRGDL